MHRLKREELKIIFKEEKFKDFFLKERNQLSARANNVLDELIDINNDFEYLIENLVYGTDYKCVRNAGFKTQLELNDFFKVIKDKVIYKEFNIEEEKSQYYNRYKDLNEVAKLNFQNLILELKQGLSVRSQNTLKKIVDSENENISILSLMANEDIEFVSIKNSGKKTSEELERFFHSLKRFFYEEKKGSDDFYILEKLNLLFGFTPTPICIENDKISQNPFDYFIQIISSYDKIKDSEREVFIALILDNLELEEAAEKIDLTYERVRQINSNILPKKINSLIKLLIREFNLEEQIVLNLPKEHQCYSPKEFEEYLSQTIFRELGVRFYDLYISPILGMFDYYLISPTSPILKACKSDLFRYDVYQSRRCVKNYWIVNKSFIKKPDLYSILYRINKTSTSRNSQDLLLEWKTFNSLKEENIHFLRDFIMKEYNIYSNNYAISIYRNTKIKLHEYIEIALEDLDKMSNIEILIDKLNELFPNKHKGFKKSSLRSTIARFKDIFIFERRQISLYGLKVWEEEKGIKGGTIKNIVLEFLKEKERPCHISEIAQHVLKFRKNSNVHSILSNLQLGTKDRFIFYKGAMIGINQSYLKSNNISLEEVSINDIISEIFDYE